MLIDVNMKPEAVPRGTVRTPAVISYPGRGWGCGDGTRGEFCHVETWIYFFIYEFKKSTHKYTPNSKMLYRQKTFLYYYLDKNEMYIKSINYCSHRRKHPNIGWTSDWEMVSLALTSGLNEISRRRNGRKKVVGRSLILITKVQWKRWINGQWAISIFFHREWAISKA